MLAVLLIVGVPNGFYYRQAFADSVANGAFDPDSYVTASEPCVEIKSGKVIAHYGQESQTITHPDVRAVDATHIRTSLLSRDSEKLVRLAAFATLEKQARAKRTFEQRKTLVGTYMSEGASPVMLTLTNFELRKCLPDCDVNAAAQCVVQGKAHWLVDGSSLIEVNVPRELCPDGRAILRRENARVFTRQQ